MNKQFRWSAAVLLVLAFCFRGFGAHLYILGLSAVKNSSSSRWV